MRLLRLAALLAPAFALFADTRTVTKTTFLGQSGGGREAIRTEYQQGDNTRFDSEVWSGNSPTHPLINVTLGQKVGYMMDPKAHEYTEYQIPQFPPSPSSHALARRVATSPSGKKLDVYFDVTDTGERKEIFGQPLDTSFGASDAWPNLELVGQVPQMRPKGKPTVGICRNQKNQGLRESSWRALGGAEARYALTKSLSTAANRPA
jgi:hypothetical protein